VPALKRSRVRSAVVIVIALADGAARLAAQRADSASLPTVQRVLRGHTLVSDSLPAAELTVEGDLPYVGAQVVNLSGNALAEQHLFAHSADGHIIDRFLWLQFEHFLPTNTFTYDYRPVRTTEFGGLQFIHDATAYPDYHITLVAPGSDGAAIAALAAGRSLTFPTRTIRVRMFHLPTADRRNELMIIYGEALADTAGIPLTLPRISLDSAYPAAARAILAHAHDALTIRPAR
jgi:hypothetical protein